MTLKRNTLFCRIASLLFLIMMVRYRAIYVLLMDPGSGIYTIAVVCLFYLLNLVSMIGLFIPKSWGFVFSYFAIPISTFLFATSYLSFVTEWIPIDYRLYMTPSVNALILIGIITLHIRRRRLQNIK